MTGAGDPPWDRSVEATYRESFAALVKTITLVCGKREVAEDLVQEAFLRSARHLASIKEPGRRAYVRAAAFNLWKNWVRRRALEIRHASAPEIGQGDTPGPEERDRLWDAVRSLPRKQRAAVVLRFYEDLSDLEIARLLGCSTVTVRSQISRALRTLEEELTDDDRR
jgi:RNA polymerase sigma-70 factor (sigma-E family)